MRLWPRFLGGFIVFAALGSIAAYLLIELRQYVEEEFFSGTLPRFLEFIYVMFVAVIIVVIFGFTVAKSYGEIFEIEIQKKERKKREKERKKRESDIEDP